MKRLTKAFVAIMLIMMSIIVSGCKPDPVITVTTYTPRDITMSSAVCGAEVLVPQGFTVDELGVCWSFYQNPTVSNNRKSTSNWSEPFVCALSDLEAGREYHVRAYALCGGECCYGEDKSFTTKAELPLVTTFNVTNITHSTASGGGEVTYDGGLFVSECGLCWSTAEEPTLEDGHCASNSVGCGEFYVEMTGLIENTTYYVRAYAINELGISYGEQVFFATMGIYYGHEYVNLGLPSGTLWATCNVGADNPEVYGDFFAWGETEPKETYNWSTYKYSLDDQYHLTKYCCTSYYGNNGFTDNLSTLLEEDDAAAVNWGEGWCMPTEEQWRELMENTTSNYATLNGVNGHLFTASNGKKLFLPAAGAQYSNGNEWEGQVGYYSSSSVKTDASCHAWHFYFVYPYIYYIPPYMTIDHNARYAGLSVRPVRSFR